MTIKWREAEKTDRPLLQAFNCTDPAPRAGGRRKAKAHPREWENDVNKSIHTLTPPYRGRDGTLLLGFDSADLVAVSLWCELADLPGWFKIRLIAIERSRRTPGGESASDLATAALAESLRRMREQGARFVVALIDRRNTASQRLFCERNFAPDPALPIDDPNLVTFLARF